MDFGKLIDIKLQGQSNWVDWKADILTLLRYNSVIGVIDGSLLKPGPVPENAEAIDVINYEKALEKYNKADSAAILAIRATLSPEVRTLVRMCPDDAKMIWNELCNHFEKKSEVRLSRLNQDFYKTRIMQSESIMGFIARLRTLWFALIKEFQTELKIELPDVLLINKILSELPPEYAEFLTTWDGTPKEKRTIDELVNRLELRDARAQASSEESSASLKDCLASTVLINKSSGSRNNKVVSTGKNYKGFRGRCYKCHKVAGHLAKDCPDREKSEKSKDNSKVMYSCFTTINVSDSDVWIKDDGATDHMTNSHLFYKTFDSFKEPVPITIGDGSSNLKAYGKGMIDVESNINGKLHVITFSEVLYVPGLIRNCFSSVQSMKKGISHSSSAKTMTAKFFCEDTREILMTAKIQNNQFELQIKPIKPKNNISVFVLKRGDEKPKSLRVWHERLFHQGKTYVGQYLNQKGIEFIKEDFFCEPCTLGKQSRRSFKPRSVRATELGEIVHADLCEPEQKSMGGSKYFLVLKDDFSKYREVFFLKNKSDTSSAIRTYVQRSIKDGIVIKEILTDGGREFDNQSVRLFLDQHGIRLRIIMPYTHEQNGVAERENRTLVELARTVLKSANLPKGLWAESVSTAAYILNLTGKSGVTGKSPYEVWYKKVASIKHLRSIGCVCYVHVPSQRRKKFDSKSIKGVLIGYCGYDGYRVYIPSKSNIVTSTNVVFDEKLDVKYSELNKCEELGSKVTSNVLKIENPVTVEDQEEIEDRVLQLVEELPTENVEVPGQRGDLDVEEAVQFQVEERLEVEEAPDDDNVIEEGSRYNLRPRDQLKKPVRYPDVMLLAADIVEPLTYRDAVKSKEHAQWQEAMEAEVNSLKKNRTWVLINLPKGKNVINSRWVFKVKKHADGTVDRFKARLVAKGYTQVAGIDYGETFSPVVRFDTVRALLAVSAREGLHLAQLDVETAFLNGDLDEEIYMSQPEGCDDGSGRVCKLAKSLYGLKQAPRCWNKKFTEFLIGYGLKESEADPCLFISDKNSKLIIGIYVDDGVVAAESRSVLEKFLSDLSSAFKIRSGPLKHYLGVEVEQLEDGSVFIDQKNYTERLITTFHQETCKPVNIPISKGQINVKQIGPGAEGLSSEERSLYRSAVGSLLYLAVGTRPDISYAVSIASQNLESPSRTDWINMKRILKYLKGTSKLGILYASKNMCDLIVYSDADYAGCSESRKSRTGVVSFYNSAPVSWFSKKQCSVSLSTTEAEFIAASEAAKEAIWLQRLFNEVGNNKNTPVILTDNQSCIHYVKNQSFHMRTKHIDVRYKFVREKYNEGLLQLKYVPSEKQIADILTKPLEKINFQSLRKMLGLSQLEKDGTSKEAVMN